ncbi:MAG: preprotein translocase subunit SecG [Lachnospiraceae bacterium]|jgi:preprotein translocase subunit SecG|nr:preprotein translocase subunit SecG [Lachnospiraceae bacterium]MCR5597982.1 preprotein translocase subunit SecG [Lachnospiraceae bacterium]
MLRTILTIIFIIDCIAIAVVVLMQKGRDQGLGALAGSSDTYWDKNKSHSLEGRMLMITRILVGIFFVMALVLSLTMF